MKAPKFGIKQKVWVKCEVRSIRTDIDGKWEYELGVPSNYDKYIRCVEEKDIHGNTEGME